MMSPMGDADGHLLEPQGGEQRLVQLAPVLGEVLGPEGIGDGARHRGGILEILDPQLHEVDAVLVEQSAGHLEGDEAVGAVILPPPQVEDADHLKTLRPRYQPHRRRNHPLRRQHRDGVADRSAQGARQVLADDHSAEDAVARLGQRREAAPPDRVGDLRDLRLEHRIDPLEGDERVDAGGRSHPAPEHRRSRRDDARHLDELRDLRLVIDEAPAEKLLHVDVGGRPDDLVPQLLLHAGHQGEGDDQGHDPDRHPQRGDGGDHRDERLPAPGQQVAGRDVELEGQRHAVSPKPMPAPVTPVTEEPGEKRAVSPVTPRLARMRGKQDLHADLTGSLVRRS